MAKTEKHAIWDAKSPTQVRKLMRDRVAKGVAAVTGSLEGFASQSKKDNAPEVTGAAIEQAGETTRRAISTTARELDKTGKKLKQSKIREKSKHVLKDVGRAARDVAITAKKEVKQTRRTAKK
jgi:DNA topoisomerase VI subunit B